MSFTETLSAMLAVESEKNIETETKIVINKKLQNDLEQLNALTFADLLILINHALINLDSLFDMESEVNSEKEYNNSLDNNHREKYNAIKTDLLPLQKALAYSRPIPVKALIPATVARYTLVDFLDKKAKSETDINDEIEDSLNNHKNNLNTAYIKAIKYKKAREVLLMGMSSIIVGIFSAGIGLAFLSLVCTATLPVVLLMLLATIGLLTLGTLTVPGLIAGTGWTLLGAMTAPNAYKELEAAQRELTRQPPPFSMDKSTVKFFDKMHINLLEDERKIEENGSHNYQKP